MGSRGMDELKPGTIGLKSGNVVKAERYKREEHEYAELQKIS